MVYFEGSVAGGIPILRSLREGLASDRIEAIAGIVNGTSNYILDAMTRSGASFAEALQAAQAAGYAEADPTLDVGGGDAAHKLALLALVAFGARVDPHAIPTEGITGVSALDIRAAGELGYLIKSLALAHDTPGGPCLRVHPTLVPRGHVLAGVAGAYNAVLVESRALGRSLYYGRGAGMMPTAVAVVSDLLEVARDLLAGVAAAAPARGPRPRPRADRRARARALFVRARAEPPRRTRSGRDLPRASRRQHRAHGPGAGRRGPGADDHPDRGRRRASDAGRARRARDLARARRPADAHPPAARGAVLIRA
jgi:hypothetical protein